MLSRKLSLERNEQLSVPDTPGLWPPSWHTESALCPNIPSASPSIFAACWLLGGWRGHYFPPFGIRRC